MASLFARRALTALPKAAPVFQLPVKTAPRAIFSAVSRVRFYSDLPSDLKYTKEHEWLRKSGGNKYTLGITDKAQKDLGEIVYVESPEVGTSFEAEEAIGSIESVKAVAEIFIPVAAKITAINESLSDEPEQLNNDPYGDGWLVEVEVANEADVQSLLTKDQYEAFLKEDE